MKKNIWPVVGMGVGFVLVIWSIKMTGSNVNFIDWPSVLITFGGSFCALLISIPLKMIINIPKALKLLLLSPKDDRVGLIVLFSELSQKARQNGLLSLEDDAANVENELLSTGLQMVVDGIEADRIRETLEMDLGALERRHRFAQDVFTKWAELAPGFGMIGTLIGLILMLAELDDPSAIGAGMATALLTTFYGSLAANLVFIPVASNLKLQTDEEVFTGELIIDGVLEIQAGSNPRVLEEKLGTYLSPSERKKLDSEGDNLRGAGSYE